MTQLELPLDLRPPTSKRAARAVCKVCGGRVIDGVCVWGPECKPEKGSKQNARS